MQEIIFGLTISIPHEIPKSYSLHMHLELYHNYLQHQQAMKKKTDQELILTFNLLTKFMSKYNIM